MSAGTATKIEGRVASAAAAVLARQRYVSAIDVLVGMGWLAPARVDDWRHRRLPFLEAGIQAGLPKISAALQAFRAWAVTRGLRPSETAYLGRSVDRAPLRFSKSGDEAILADPRTRMSGDELSSPASSAAATPQPDAGYARSAGRRSSAAA